MKKNKTKTISSLIAIFSLLTLMFSGWLLLVPGKVKITSFGKCRIDCPNGPPATCEGRSTQTIDESTSNPGCECDGVPVHCDDVKKNGNTNSNVNPGKTKKDSKEKNTNNTGDSNHPV